MENIEQVKKQPIQNKNGEFIVACPHMKNNHNVSMLVRTASCLGISSVIITGQNKINPKITRDIDIPVRTHNTLLPVVKKYKSQGYCIIGLEQTNRSCNIYEYQFPTSPIMLIIGNETRGMSQDLLDELDDVVEIPLFNRPHSLNAAVATSICLYEYTRQCIGR